MKRTSEATDISKESGAISIYEESGWPGTGKKRFDRLTIKLFVRNANLIREGMAT